MSAFIVFDLEYTTWPGALERGWDGEGEAREVIEIGAVRADEETLAPLETFSTYVRPVLNPYLSAYCTELTGITQERIEREGVLFPEALDRFLSWSADATFLSWGRDADILMENCTIHALPALPLERFLDARDVFNRAGIDTARYHSSTILEAFDRVPEGEAHRALSDAANVLRALQELKTRSV